MGCPQLQGWLPWQQQGLGERKTSTAGSSESLDVQPTYLFCGEPLPASSGTKWPPGLAMQSKSEDTSSLSGPGQEAQALLLPFTQGTLPLVPFPPGRPRASAFSLQSPRPGGNQERTQIWSQKGLIDHSFTHSFSRHLWPAHNIPAPAPGAVTWG